MGATLRSKTSLAKIYSARTLGLYRMLRGLEGISVSLDKNRIGESVIIEGKNLDDLCRNYKYSDRAGGKGKNPVVVLSEDKVILQHAESNHRYKRRNLAVVQQVRNYHPPIE